MYLIELRYFVCGQNGLIEQVDHGCLKVLEWSAVMNPSLIQNQVQQEQRGPF